MENFKYLTSYNDVPLLSKALQKIAKLIKHQKKDPSKNESNIEELTFLKEQCMSDNVQLSLLSNQTLYGLVEIGVLEPANVLTMFITMLSNANTPMQVSIVGEGIINILLLDLKRLKPHELYVCPFGMKTAQHPIITVLQKNIDVLDFANKLNGICTHSDERIQSNSIEFLRPVFLHSLCNPLQTLNVENIWSVLLKQQRSNLYSARTLIHEIFTWLRITPLQCLRISKYIIDGIEFCLETNNHRLAVEYQMYLMALVLSMIEFGYDPRNAFAVILNTIQQNNEKIDEDIVDYMLVTMPQIIRSIPPLYLGNALKIIKVLIEQKKYGNVIIRNMLLDSLIVRLAISGKNIQAQAQMDIEGLMKQLIKHSTNSKISSASNKSDMISVKYFHPSIVMNFNIVYLSRKLCCEMSSNQIITLKHIVSIICTNKKLAVEIHFLLRSVLLSMEQENLADMWSEILKILLTTAKENRSISGDAIYFVLYLLAKETYGHRQLELLRGLTSLTIKENIPLVLNTYRSLSSSSSVALRILSIDLHTRLWQADSRTYQFLHKLLIADDEQLKSDDKWEMHVVKANAIKEICSQKGSQHGTDLVAPLSKILNCSLDNDLASSLALSAVLCLCKSHTVNIVSTWKVLETLFESKLKIRTTKSLCEFFGEVPLLKSPSNDYNKLFNEALNRLWKATDSDNVEIITTAMRALQNFDFGQLTLQHVPSILFDNIKLPREYLIQIAASHSDPNNVQCLTAVDVVPYIPGFVWIELLKHINQNALDAGIEFLVYLIENEISQYRSGVYMLAEGRPEPKEFQHLHNRSPLQALIKFIREQSENKDDFLTAIKCLECVERKYSRPFPPLNWFFLIEYVNQGSKFENCNSDNQFKMKKYALTIAGNQIAQSGSAKVLIESYLQSFDATIKEPNEIQMALNLVANIFDGVSPQILSSFIHDTLTFLHGLSASSNFEETCCFGQGLETIVKAFDKKCLVPENIDIITDEICRFNDILPSNSEIYNKYSTYVLKLPNERLDRLSNLAECNDENFRKSLALRTKAVSSHKPFPTAANPLMWLNILIDNIFDPTDSSALAERKESFLAKISNILTTWSNESFLRAWIVYFLGKVQSDLAQDTNERSLFSLNLFMIFVINASGCVAFINEELTMNNQIEWLKKFPEALLLLSKRSNWTSHMPRIYEFLYHLKMQQTNLPKEYNSIVHYTLICVKNDEYFLQKSTWSRFISLK